MAREGKLNREYEENPGLQVLVRDWPHWLPFVTFLNGDAFCIDMKNQSVVFLEHDVMDGGPYIHGTKVADDIDKLFEKWMQIAFVDVYDWSKFVNEEGINLAEPGFSLLLDKFRGV